MIKEQIQKIFASTSPTTNIKLEAANDYTSSLPIFIAFLEDVSLCDREFGLSVQQIYKVKTVIQKMENQFGSRRLIRPLKRFCLRFLNQHLGLNIIHTYFLKLCKDSRYIRQAIDVLYFPALPKKLNAEEYGAYQKAKGQILLQLQRYDEAYINLRGSLNKRRDQPQEELDTLKKVSLLSALLGKTESPQYINTQFQAIKNNASFYKIEEQVSFQERVIIPYFQISKGHQISVEQDIKIINLDGNSKLFNLTVHRPLRNYIKSSIIENNYRLLTDNIKQISLSEFENAKMINNPTRLYRYNNKDKTIQFNFKTISKQQNSQTITKCMNMYQQLCNYYKGKQYQKIEESEPTKFHTYS